MQRATQKDEKTKKEEEVMPAAGDFPHSSAVKRWYVCGFSFKVFFVDSYHD